MRTTTPRNPATLTLMVRMALLVLTACATTQLRAQEAMLVHRADGVTMALPVGETESVSIPAGAEQALFHLAGTTGTVAVEQIDSITFGPMPAEIAVRYAAGGVRVLNPYAFRGVDITVGDGAAVVANSVRTDELTYRLSGEGTGSFKLYSPKKQRLCLDSLRLCSPDGPAINIQSKKKTTVELAGQCALTDGTTCTPCGDEDMKATFFSEGQLVFEPTDGTLTLAANVKHALCSDDYISISGGNIVVTAAASDGIHTKDSFEMTGGMVLIDGIGGDCIDGDAGAISISGGTLRLTTPTADTKALKCDSTISISGGSISLNLNADRVKGIKAGQLIDVSGGTIAVTATGGVLLVDNDPSYCTALKSDADICITGGDISIRHTGQAGKGLSADANVTITGGNIEITVEGDGSTYTNASGQTDTYSATCIKADGALSVEGGTLVLASAGTGGKCLSTDGTTTIGLPDGTGPDITATTTGTAIGGGSTGGGWGPGGGWGGGGPGGPGGGPGWGQSSTGGKPKAIRSEGNLTVNGGHVKASTANDGGEGLESKQTLTVNGGIIEADTYDDALNAGTAIVINGGYIYAYGSGNDGIDSNGTLTIAGGVVVSSGTTAPEEGFDCDQNTFKVTGGTFVGFGGSNSSPTRSVCTQCAVAYSAAANTSTTYTVVRQSDGQHVMSFCAPRNYNTASMLFSSPLISEGDTYVIYSGGTLSGGDTFHGLTTGGEYVAGTRKKTFTPTSKLTSVR